MRSGLGPHWSAQPPSHVPPARQAASKPPPERDWEGEAKPHVEVRAARPQMWMGPQRGVLVLVLPAWVVCVGARTVNFGLDLNAAFFTSALPDHRFGDY